MTAPAMDHLLQVTRDLVAATPELRAFAPWPEAPAPNPLPPLAIPAIPLVTGLRARTTERTAPLLPAVAAAAPLANWQQTYSEAEVGRDFLDRYGWFELLGPTGHFLSRSLRAYIAFWGAGLHYPTHLHEAEELYYVIAGAAEFRAENRVPALLGPEGTRHHASNQPHAMDTHDAPVLTLVLWRGAGLGGAARMGTK